MVIGGVHRHGMGCLGAVIEQGRPITHVKDHRGQDLCTTEWVTPFLTEAAGFTADDSHDFDDQVDTILDAVADMLINDTSSFFSGGWIS